MQEVIISIKPEWCKFIMSGNKALELRKNGPKGKEPFKVYIYCSKGGKKIYQNGKLLNGKVIGEFECPGVINFGRVPFINASSMRKIEDLSCVSFAQMACYAEPKPLHGWVIANSFFYTFPKELSEFGVSRAPQSWQYIHN